MLSAAAHCPRRADRPAAPFHGQDIAGGPKVGDLAGGVAQRVEELELRPVVVRDRGEVLVERQLHQLECVDGFLRPIDQDQDVAEAGRMP